MPKRKSAFFIKCGFLGSRDYAQALAWYHKAASHGNSNAENQLGFLAEKGWGEAQDYVEALTWYYKAAEHGNDNAQENLGYLYQHGFGVEMDYAKAMAWYYNAAGQGNGNAENQLGWMYQFGMGVTPDNAQALTWYRTAAAQGNKYGIENLQALTTKLKAGDGSLWQAANASAVQAVNAQSERRARITDLRRRIAELEFDAQQEENLAAQMEQPRTGAAAAVINTIGAVGAVKFRLEAEKYHAEAARLRVELAEMDNDLAARLPNP